MNSSCFHFAGRGSMLLLLAFTTKLLAADPFAENVRTTEPLTPEQQLKTFHLPPGFEVQLVASEPEFIGKPMNMAWDAKGRLWVTVSREYPFPVGLEQKGRDQVKVFEDFDPQTGKARKITTFVEGLNVPIGLYPYKNGVIAFSIPNVYFFQDTDGDGVSDKSEIVMSRYGFEKDTHGMTGAFRRGYDGWLYADHGFNNDSTLKAKDGSEIKLNSGNVYRMKIDGSRIEQFTWGQVNPFGLAFDHLGDLWSTDCHSSPVYMLLKGAYYPSFGKPHDGLGFAPNICAHSHGSTAIAGAAFYAATNFPKEFQNNIFIGNVMTSRVNRDSFIEKGSTRIAKEEPDFVKCDDPWFRPVDLQIGPDGALYIADFYNRIIGHYEVPLTHPGRDRERGRIWRIVYTGGTQAPATPVKKSKQPMNLWTLPSDTKGLIAELGNANIIRRMLATDQLVDTVGQSAVIPLQTVFRNNSSSAVQKVHAAWALHRLGAFKECVLKSPLRKSDKFLSDPLVRIHLMRIYAANSRWSDADRDLILRSLRDPDAYVRRSAAAALANSPSPENFRALAEAKKQASPEDSQLTHVVRMAIRDQLLPATNFAAIVSATWPEEASRMIADAAVGVKNAEAGRFLVKHVQTYSESRDKLTSFLGHAARYAPESSMNDLANFTRAKFSSDLDFQLALFKSVQEGLQQRGAKMEAAVQDWGVELAQKLLVSVDPDTMDWRNTPIKGGDTTNPWIFQERPCADGKNTQVISSLAPGGEKYTGILRSRPFDIPAKFSFYLCGHDGSPEKPPRNKNMIRLRDAESNKVLAQQYPPRNDTAQLITWDLKKYAGKRGVLELVDGNGGSSYAWIGVGRLNPEVVPFPSIIPNQVDKRQLSAAELAETLRLKKMEPGLATLLKSHGANEEARAAAAKALLTLNGSAHVQTFSAILADGEEGPKLRQKCAEALAQIGSSEARNTLMEVLRSASQNLQTQIAMALASNAEGAEALLGAVESGKVPAYALQERTVKDRIVAANPKDAAKRIDELTKNLTPISVEKQKLIDTRRAAFLAAESSAENGVQIFTRNCAVCHKIGDQGALVGPQLDGIGNRGADRLIEDILDPNRNVDHAFRYSNVTLKDEQIISGLFRREEGEVLVFADSTGKEVSVPKKEIAERRESENSLMPDNFDQILPENEFNDLIAYLLSKGKN